MAVRSSRKLLLALTLAAIIVAALQNLAGLADAALYAAPLLLLVGLLLGGRYVGEDRLLALGARPPRRRRDALSRRWPRVSLLPPLSLLERSPHRLRGPPAPLIV